MPRKPNYNFEKRQKELDRKARKEEKAQRRREGGSSDEPTAQDLADLGIVGVVTPGGTDEQPPADANER